TPECRLVRSHPDERGGVHDEVGSGEAILPWARGGDVTSDDVQRRLRAHVDAADLRARRPEAIRETAADEAERTRDRDPSWNGTVRHASTSNIRSRQFGSDRSAALRCP